MKKKNEENDAELSLSGIPKVSLNSPHAADFSITAQPTSQVDAAN